MTRDAVLKILKEYYDANREKYGIVKLGMFGSVARNEATEDSDVDVVVELIKPDLFVLGRIHFDLTERLGTSIDLVRKGKRLRPSFASRLETDACYV